MDTGEGEGVVIGTGIGNAADSQELAIELERRTAQLAHSEAALEEVRQAISHDLQAPLTTISGFADLLARRYADQLDNNATEFVAFIVGGAKRFGHMLNDLVAYLQVGERQPPAAPVDCARLVRGVVDSLPAQLAASKGSVTVEPLPHIRGDSTQIGFVFRELISNALKFSDEPPRVRIAAAHEGSETCFAVVDNGPGIDLGHEGRIFELFQRVSARDDGTGSGLAICKKIVERHGGRIWAERPAAGGTVFKFTIPDR